jgi:Rps23 Pro-64 3,4-dihydroxylase Tpa1-like proline 4-hydroxylase
MLKREAKLTGVYGGTASSERDKGAEVVVSIIPDQITSLHGQCFWRWHDDNYEAGKRFCRTERILSTMYYSMRQWL